MHIGSPPPTRGTAVDCNRECLYIRITPAYAGNSIDGRIYGFMDEDHPRLRGEQELTGVILDGCSGSPPPTRGTAEGAHAEGGGSEITPAYAGNSNTLQSRNISREDHPRLRGEQIPYHAAA